MRLFIVPGAAAAVLVGLAGCGAGASSKAERTLTAAAGGAGGSLTPLSAPSIPSASAPAPSASPSGALGGLDGPATGLRSAQESVTEAYREAVAHPGNRVLVGRLLAWYAPGTKARRAIAGVMSTLAEDGFAGRPGPKGYQVIESVTIGASGATGAVTTCTYDDGIIYDTHLSDTHGNPVLVNDDVVTKQTISHWVLRGGAWRVKSASEIKRWPNVNRCPAPQS